MLVEICPSTFAPSTVVPFNVTENIAFLCIFYFDYHKLYLEIFCSRTQEKVFPLHAETNVIEIEHNRYMRKVGFREKNKNYLIEDLSFVTSDNCLFFSAGTYCNAQRDQADFVYKINYDVKMHRSNLANDSIEQKWQKVFSVIPKNHSNPQSNLVTAHVVTKAFNRIWTIGAKGYAATPKWSEQRMKDLKFNSILAGVKGTNELYSEENQRKEETIKEYNDPLAGFAIDVNLGLSGKPLWAISLLDTLYIGTSVGIYAVRENKDKKTQGYANIVQSIDIGTAKIKPCVLGQMVCFVSNNKRSIYAVLPSNNQNIKNKTVDLNVSASNIFSSDIKQLISVNQPMQMLIAIKCDGTFAMYTYNNDLNVAAWTNHALGGKGHILSACSVFDKQSLGDVIYFNVLRKKEICEEKEDTVTAIKAKQRRQILDEAIENQESNTQDSTETQETNESQPSSSSTAPIAQEEYEKTVKKHMYQPDSDKEQKAKEAEELRQKGLQQEKRIQKAKRERAEKIKQEKEKSQPESSVACSNINPSAVPHSSTKQGEEYEQTQAYYEQMLLRDLRKTQKKNSTATQKRETNQSK